MLHNVQNALVYIWHSSVYFSEGSAFLYLVYLYFTMNVANPTLFFKDSRDYRRKDWRPTGKISSINHYNELYVHAKKMTSRLAKLKDVIGVTLGGGLSRGYGDKLSEIDLNVFLSNKAYKKWIQGMSLVPQGDCLIDGIYFDISFLNYADEKKQAWLLDKKWDASYQKILYDPHNLLDSLLRSKDVFTAQEKYQLAMSSYLQVIYIGGIMVDQWILRGDLIAANQVINEGANGLLNLVYLANEEFPPFKKWSINYSYSLKWLPRDWSQNIALLMVNRENSINEVKRRNNLLQEMYQECWAHLFGDDYKDIGLMELQSLKELKYIKENHPTLRKFSKMFTRAHLSYEPLFNLIKIRSNAKRECVKIYFDQEAFKQQKKKGFSDFLEWNKRILELIPE